MIWVFLTLSIIIADCVFTQEPADLLLTEPRGRSQLSMCPVRHTGAQARQVTQGMVIPCSSRLMQYERLCVEPEGPVIVENAP